MSKKGIKVLAALALLVLFLSILFTFSRSKSFARDRSMAGQLVEVQRDDFAWTVSATGVIEPLYVTEIRSMASGEIKEIRVEVGAQVRQGQLLLQLDPKLEQRRVNQAKADLAIAQATYQKASVSYRHANRLHQTTQKLLQRPWSAEKKRKNSPLKQPLELPNARLLTPKSCVRVRCYAKQKIA